MTGVVSDQHLAVAHNAQDDGQEDDAMEETEGDRQQEDLEFTRREGERKKRVQTRWRFKSQWPDFGHRLSLQVLSDVLANLEEDYEGMGFRKSQEDQRQESCDASVENRRTLPRIFG